MPQRSPPSRVPHPLLSLHRTCCDHSPDANTWVQASLSGDIIPSLCSHSFFEHEGRGYIFGGTDAQATNRNDLYRLSLQLHKPAPKIARRPASRVPKEATDTAQAAIPAEPAAAKRATEPVSKKQAPPKPPAPARPPAATATVMATAAAAAAPRTGNVPQMPAKPTRSRPGSVNRPGSSATGTPATLAPEPPSLEVPQDVFHLPATSAIASPVQPAAMRNFDAQRAAMMQVRV